MTSTTITERAKTQRYKVGKMPRDPRTLAPAEHLKAVVYALTNISPVTRELVRMRNGIIQDCHRCMSLRSELAVNAGLTDAMMEAVRHFETDVRFSEAQKAALRFADAYLLHPWEIGDSIKADIQKYFTNQEILELVIRLYFNTINRTGRATGTDQDEIVVEVTNRF